MSNKEEIQRDDPAAKVILAMEVTADSCWLKEYVGSCDKGLNFHLEPNIVLFCGAVLFSDK